MDCLGNCGDNSWFDTVKTMQPVPPDVYQLSPFGPRRTAPWSALPIPNAMGGCGCGMGENTPTNMVGNLVATDANGQQTVIASGVAPAPVVTGGGIVTHPAGFVVGAGLSAGVGALIAHLLGYSKKTFALAGAGISIAFSAYNNYKATGSMMP